MSPVPQDGVDMAEHSDPLSTNRGATSGSWKSCPGGDQGIFRPQEGTTSGRDNVANTECATSETVLACSAANSAAVAWIVLAMEMAPPARPQPITALHRQATSATCEQIAWHILHRGLLSRNVRCSWSSSTPLGGEWG